MCSAKPRLTLETCDHVDVDLCNNLTATRDVGDARSCLRNELFKTKCWAIDAED